MGLIKKVPKVQEDLLVSLKVIDDPEAEYSESRSEEDWDLERSMKKGDLKKPIIQATPEIALKYEKEDLAILKD